MKRLISKIKTWIKPNNPEEQLYHFMERKPCGAISNNIKPCDRYKDYSCTNCDFGSLPKLTDND